MARTLVVELLTEELPPKALLRLGDAFAAGIEAGLRARGFLGKTSRATGYATPRRLGTSITEVADSVTEPRRPIALVPIDVAFDDGGKATSALDKAVKAKTGFEAAAVVPAERLERRSDGKMERLYYVEPPVAVSLRSALQQALDEAIDKLPAPKLMSYQDSRGETVRFARPAHKLLALHGEQVVPVEALGLAAGDLTDGHRFLSHADLKIESAEAYAPTLEGSGKVWPSFVARRARIVAALEKASGHARIVMPDALLDEVTALTEWPVVYEGTFDRAFLEVPQECLILTMQKNQRYFALADADGRIRHHFLIVSNIETRDPGAIIHGNERVLRARLADAKFFYDQDRKSRLESRLPRLAAIVYHNRLGTLADRTARLRSVAVGVAAMLGADPALADRAALLAKADLVTDMVGEFPELQGTMGRYYARHDGEPAEVADAIADHYLPRHAGDDLPQTAVAQSVALADKLDALAGMFEIGQAPTGDRDPFGLRRAALGVIRILIEKKRRLSLPALFDLAFAALAGQRAAASANGSPAAVLDFVYERLRGYLRDLGYTANQVAAVVDSRPDVIDDLPERLDAVRAFEALPEALSLSAANKRIVNILRKAESEAGGAVDRGVLAAGAENDLHAAFDRLRPMVERGVADGDFATALKALASIKPTIDRFFDDVMVMADDPKVRANRLALLREVAATMNHVADISKLAV
ncbi:MAG TPA: glycine--tRNA ligase subunit beta [Casimicrobiaceae bacterium]|nr:glycine--tRNA ligase subunit beta [Casimicrobiaceae bacterium]